MTRLLGPFDLFLQARDRSLLVDDPAHAKALWPTLGRPGAVLDRGELVGTWRPRKSGSALTVDRRPLVGTDRRPRRRRPSAWAAFRGLTLKSLDVSDLTAHADEPGPPHVVARGCDDTSP